MKDIISALEIDHLREHDGYEELLEGIKQSFEKHTLQNGTRLFTTDASGLYDLFLENLPEEARQHYNCHACRHFVNRFGGLAVIDRDTGTQTPIMWDFDVPEFFYNAVSMLWKTVKKAKVNGTFVTSEQILGCPKTGCWEHMSAKMPSYAVYSSPLHTAWQMRAEDAEEHKMLCMALTKYTKDSVREALNILRSDVLYRGHELLGRVEWLYNLYERINQPGVNKRNLLWFASAHAPAGFCHISSGMVGTLLDDIQDGLPLEDVKRRFAEKMNPTQYRRPQAKPAAGNVVQAEKIVERLGIKNSLLRRFARLDEIQAIWKPTPKTENKSASGVFAGVETKESKSNRANISGRIPIVTMTWEKFSRTVLPTAKKIEFSTEDSENLYSAIVTTQDESAPPIIQWDMPDNRCPFNWYVYAGMSTPTQWNLTPHTWVEVTAVTLQPNMWVKNQYKASEAVFFILAGCKDTGYQTCGSALFPEVLKSELHEIRSTIEAYSRNSVLGGYEDASACGIRLQKDNSSLSRWNAKFKVTTETGQTIYRLDRWD